MKLSHFLIIALFGGFVMVISCNDKKEDPATEQTTLTPDGTSMTLDPAMGATASTSTEAHFKCPKNCEGGTGDAKGPCPVCGTEMAHNQAFHAAQNTAAGAAGSSPAGRTDSRCVRALSPDTSRCRRSSPGYRAP